MSEEVSTQRIAISTDGVEIDSSQGDLLSEAVLLGTIVVVVALLYIGRGNEGSPVTRLISSSSTLYTVDFKVSLIVCVTKK